VVRSSEGTPSAAAGTDPFRQAFDAAPDGILVIDSSGTVVIANPKALEMFGYTRSELVGVSVERLLPPSRRTGHVKYRAAYTRDPRSRAMGSGLDLHGWTKSGEEFPVEISLSPMSGTGHADVVAVIRDVTDRRRDAEELARAHEQLAVVDDRERIARDLHDTVIQRLFAIGLSLQAALARSTDPRMSERSRRRSPRSTRRSAISVPRSSA
jgi:PAS domain S-box-containing protein